MEVSLFSVLIPIFISLGSISSDDGESVNGKCPAFNWTNATGDNGTGSDEHSDKQVLFGTLHTLQNLSKWADHEQKISKVLTERLELIEFERKLIKEYLRSYKDTSEKAIEHVREPQPTPKDAGEIIGSSAVLGHIMITRYTSVISRLREFLESPAYTKNRDHAEKIMDLGENEVNRTDKENKMNLIQNTSLPAIWPGWEDKYMSALAFSHIQEVYGYLTENLRFGLHVDTHFGGTLNAHQCAEMGIFALQTGYIYMAVEWLELANRLVVEDDSISKDIVSSMLSIAIQENNRRIRYVYGMNLTDDDWGTEEFYFMADNIYIKPIREGMPEENKTTGLGRYLSSRFNFSYIEDGQFVYLCQGKTYQSPKVAATLKCYYERKRHPYLYISPVKVEQLSASPPVFQFYEMVGPNEIERIKDTGLPDMTLSQLVGEQGYEKTTKFRTSVGTGLMYEDIPNVIKLAEMVTGLTLKNTSEPTQLASYTYGRFYTFHTDAFESEEEAQETVAKDGDRLATILYYLELPDYGGLTPFLAAGVSAHPIRGSAILWYNIYQNGTVRQDVTHGACPVIHGHKIIMNHWVRYLGNFRTFKCSLNQFE